MKPLNRRRRENAINDQWQSELCASRVAHLVKAGFIRSAIEHQNWSAGHAKQAREEMGLEDDT